MPLEVCVNSVHDAVKAETAGAARIELCANLNVGGLTPEPDDIKAAKQLLGIPFRVMIRCRPGNFVYSPDEISLMEQQTLKAKETGADGIVFGALLENGSVDEAALIKIKNAATPLPLTFHRAFDECVDPYSCIQSIIRSGCKTLLTSGLHPFSWQGWHLIKDLQVQFGDKIEIMAGSGITDLNAVEIIRKTGVQWIHASARIASPKGKIINEEMIRKITSLLLTLKNS